MYVSIAYRMTYSACVKTIQYRFEEFKFVNHLKQDSQRTTDLTAVMAFYLDATYTIEIAGAIQAN